MAGRRAVVKAAEAFDRVVDFLESFEALDDHRQRGKVLYRLDEILLLVLLAVIAGCDSWVEIEKFGQKNSICYGGSARSRTARRRTINSATSLQPSMPNSSRAASSRGSAS